MAGTNAPPADALTDLFGLLAYAELVAFFNLSGDAARASSLADKAALGEMAVTEFGHFRALHDELTRRGAVPEQAMEPFVAPLDAFHARTAPADWRPNTSSVEVRPNRFNRSADRCPNRTVSSPAPRPPML